MRWRNATLISIVGIAAIGCSDPLGPREDRLAEARVAWALAGPAGYEFVFQRLCFCGPDTVRPVRIEVRFGEVTAVTVVETGEALTDLGAYPTIEDLFAEIEDAIEQDAFSLDAQYHGDLGYPVEVSIDYLENAVDEEMVFRVSSFRDLGLLTGG
jgi:hypothetical protein